MDIALDTEFQEYPEQNKIELISIGLVAADGSEFYAVSNQFNPETCSKWVKDNVLNQLPPKEEWISRAEISRKILNFTAWMPTRPRFITWFGAYDWTLFCMLFGGMINLPDRYQRYPTDIRQELESIHGVESASLRPIKPVNEHDALADARWTMDFWKNIQRYYESVNI